MVEIRFDKKFTEIFSKIKDKLLRTKITKQIKKISESRSRKADEEYKKRHTGVIYQTI